MSDQSTESPLASLPSHGHLARPLDDIDRKILGVLTADARVSIRTLADRVHVSRSSAHARVERLIADGVITGFRAEIDPWRAGLGTSAHIAMAIDQNAWRTIAAELREMPYVVHVALLAGEHDVLMVVRAPDNATLRHVILDRIQRIDGVLHTRTWLCFEEFAGGGTSWA